MYENIAKKRTSQPLRASRCLFSRRSIKQRSPDTSSWGDVGGHPSAGPAVQGRPSKVGLAPSAKVYAVRWGSQQTVSPSPNTQSVDASMLVFGVCRCPRAPKHKMKDKSTSDPEACAGCSRSGAGNCAARGWQGTPGWLSAQGTSLVGRSWVGFSPELPLR